MQYAASKDGDRTRKAMRVAMLVLTKKIAVDQRSESHVDARLLAALQAALAAEDSEDEDLEEDSNTSLLGALFAFCWFFMA